MLTKNQRDRIARKFTAVVAYAIDRLPDFLETCEPERAAEITVSLIKAHIAAPPEPTENENGETLASVLARLAASHESRKEAS